VSLSLRLALIGALACVAIFALPPRPAAAWTAAGLSVFAQQEDRFTTYDFETAGSASAAACDWPVTMVFWGHASVAKVKQALASSLPSYGNEMYARVSETRCPKRSTWRWVADRGVKSLSFSRALHLRLYADGDGRLTNGAWGDYVIGTTHLDLDEVFSANPVYGYSEQAAGEIEALCASVFGTGNVVPDSLPLGNVEVDRTEQRANAKGGVDSHYWQCDGLATMVYVP